MQQQWAEKCEAWLVEVQDHLRDRLIPFWAKRVLSDPPAYSTAFDAEGKALQGSRITLVSQAQTLFAFAQLVRAGLGGDEARTCTVQGVDFLLDNFWDDRHAGWYDELDGDGSILYGDKHLSNQALAILALSEFGMATGDLRGMEWAVRTFETCQTFISDNRFGGYIESLATDWSGNSNEHSAPLKGLRSHIYLLSALVNMYEATGTDVYARNCIDLMDLILEKFIDSKSGLAVAWRAKDWSPARGPILLHLRVRDGRLPAEVMDESAVCYADNFDSLRLLFHALNLLGLDNAPYLERIRRVYDALLSSAFDLEGGGVLAAGLASGGALDLRKDYATQAAAMASLLHGYAVFKEDIFLTNYEALHNLVFDRFVCPEPGEWTPLLDQRNIPILTQLGDPWKTPFHTVCPMVEVESLLLKLTL